MTTNQQRARELRAYRLNWKKSDHLKVTTISINDIADRLSQVNLDTDKQQRSMNLKLDYMKNVLIKNKKIF